MNEIELLEHVLANRKAGRDAGHGLLYDGEPSWAMLANHILWQRRKNYSIAPRTHEVNGFTVPAPEPEAPEKGATYYIPDPLCVSWVDSAPWSGYVDELLALKRGCVFLTVEAARANAMAQLGSDPEGTE